MNSIRWWCVAILAIWAIILTIGIVGEFKTLLLVAAVSTPVELIYLFNHKG